MYSLPAVAVQVLALTSQPQTDARALQDCIEKDPALTVKILRVANSSLFGLSREVSDLNQALALLGTKRLKLLVLGFSLPKELFAGLEAEVLSRYWRHALTKAVAARQISERFWHRAGDEAFIAGMLQDIGMLVLIQELGDSYITPLDRAFGEGGDLAQLEKAALGFDHAMLSARLLDQWGLPPSLVQAVALSRQWETVRTLPPDSQPLPHILHLAELLAQLLARNKLSALEPLLEAGQRACGLQPEQLEALVADLGEKVSQLAAVLSLELPGDLRYVDLLVEAHKQLADMAEQISGQVPAATSKAEALLQEVRALRKAIDGAVGRPLLPAAGSPAPPAGSRPAARPSGLSKAAQSELAGEQPGPVSGRSPLDPGLLGRVTAAVNAARQRRRALSVILAEIDDYDDLILHGWRDTASRQVDQLASAIDGVCDPGDVYLHVGDGRFALILADCDRPQAVQIARQLIEQTAAQSQSGAEGGLPALSVSAGLASLAVPPKNFPPHELIEAAERCLYAAKALGGSGVKSIDLC